MKPLLKYAFIIISFFLFCHFNLHSQARRHHPGDDDPTGVIRDQVAASVNARFGPDYNVAIFVLDSAIAWNESTHNGGELTDPYGTLKGYIIFGADKKSNYDDEHGIMGLYKDGQIVWNSDSVFKGEWYGIYSIKDINKDGKVEILVDWTQGRS